MNGVQVRPLVAEDMTEVLSLVDQMASARARQGVSAQVVSARVMQHLMDADGARLRAVVACRGDRVVGVMTMSQDDSFGLADVGGIRIHLIHVVEAERHRGVGAAMLTVAVDWAEELGEDAVVVEVPDQGRDIKRWLSKLGFGSETSLRSQRVDSLRRRIGYGSAAMGPGRRDPRRRGFRSRVGLNRRGSSTRSELPSAQPKKPAAPPARSARSARSVDAAREGASDSARGRAAGT